VRPKKKLNLWPWMERLTIKNKDAKLERLSLTPDSEFYWSQAAFLREVERQYNEGRPIRIIVLKARQLGISTATEGLLFNWCFLFPGTNALVLSKDRENSETIFEMAKLMWDQWPLRALFSTTRASARRLSWAETLSNFRVATAKGTQVGRGSTIRAVHGSEVAFWENADELMPPLNEAVPMAPGTIIVLESTANGVGGFFYDTWMAAERGESDYVPMFFPWNKHGEYRVDRHNLTNRMLTPREKDLMERYDLDLAQLAWRRRKIRTNNWSEEKFDEEYPISPEVAFLSTGRNVFPLDALSDCFFPPGKVGDDGQMVGASTGKLVNVNGTLKFVVDRAGELKVFKTPARSEPIEYVVAADPSRSLDGDPCCIQVLRRDNLEQVAVWRGWATHNEFAEHIADLAAWYNEALVNCEMEGGGLGVIGVLQHLRVPNLWRWRMADRPLHKRGNVYGWSTNSKSKGWMMGQLIHHVSTRGMVIHDQTTYREMREYINIDGIEMGPASADGHDDTVMALGIAFITTITENPVNFEAIYGMGRLARDQTMSETPSGDQMPSSLELVTAYGEID
jgi:hypothetical protein